MTVGRNSVPPAFGRRLQRERESRHWSMREVSGKCGLAPSTIMRAEKGSDVSLGNAAALAALYGVSLDALLAEVTCTVCDGLPPAGFICSACKREAASPREAGTV
jgi:transcriptional regulator with XRE-family HTH domain